MGEQPFQQEAGMLREAETDRAADSVKPVSSEDKQELHIEEDDEPDMWRRASPEAPFFKMFDQITGLLGHAVHDYGKSLEKQIKNIKRF